MIETARLRLRELTEADAPALLALYGDPAVMQFMGAPPGSLEEEIANIAAHRSQYYHARGYGLWGVTPRGSDDLIGRCGLLDVPLEGRTELELSYLLAPAYWGQGLATEAARAVLEFAAGRLGLGRVVAFIHPDNVRSRRVAQRLGMQLEGTVSYRAFGQVDLFAWSATPEDELRPEYDFSQAMQQKHGPC